LANIILGYGIAMRCGDLKALRRIEPFLVESVLSTLLIARRNWEGSYPRW